MGRSPGRTVEYEDVGDGPVIACPRVVMNSTLWRHVVPWLAPRRVITPTLPLGSHRRPMNPGADLTMRGQVHYGRLPGCPRPARGDPGGERLGGPLFLTAEGRDERLGRLWSPVRGVRELPARAAGRFAYLGTRTISAPAGAARLTGGLAPAVTDEAGLECRGAGPRRRGPGLDGAGPRQRPIRRDLMTYGGSHRTPWPIPPHRGAGPVRPPARVIWTRQPVDAARARSAAGRVLVRRPGRAADAYVLLGETRLRPGP